jgi:hypothetical protein
MAASRMAITQTSSLADEIALARRRVYAELMATTGNVDRFQRGRFKNVFDADTGHYSNRFHAEILKQDGFPSQSGVGDIQKEQLEMHHASSFFNTI